MAIAPCACGSMVWRPQGHDLLTRPIVEIFDSGSDFRAGLSVLTQHPRRPNPWNSRRLKRPRSVIFSGGPSGGNAILQHRLDEPI